MLYKLFNAKIKSDAFFSRRVTRYVGVLVSYELMNWWEWLDTCVMGQKHHPRCTSMCITQLSEITSCWWQQCATMLRIVFDTETAAVYKCKDVPLVITVHFKAAMAWFRASYISTKKHQVHSSDPSQIEKHGITVQTAVMGKWTDSKIAKSSFGIWGESLVVNFTLPEHYGGWHHVQNMAAKI